MKIFFFIEYKNNNFKNHILKNNFEDEFLLSFLGSDGERSWSWMTHITFSKRFGNFQPNILYTTYVLQYHVLLEYRKEKAKQAFLKKIHNY